MPVTVLLLGMPHSVPLQKVAYFLEKLFDTDEISTFHARSLHNHKKTKKRQIALDFMSGFDAMTAQEILDEYKYDYNNIEYILQARITQKKEFVVNEPNNYVDETINNSRYLTCKRFKNNPHSIIYGKQKWYNDDNYAHTSYGSNPANRMHNKYPTPMDGQANDAQISPQHRSRNTINNYYDYTTYEINEGQYQRFAYKETSNKNVTNNKINYIQQSKSHIENNKKEDGRIYVKDNHEHKNAKTFQNKCQFKSSHINDIIKSRINEATIEIYTEMENELDIKCDVQEKIKQTIYNRINEIKPNNLMLVSHIVACYRSMYPKTRDRELLFKISRETLNEEETKDNSEIEIEVDIDNLISDRETWQLLDEVLEDEI